MTQHYIRRLAGYGPIRRSMMRLHEPRIVSIIYGTAYTLAAIIGIVAVFHPPQTIEHVAGSVIIAVLATCITAGGALGHVTIFKGWYWIERYAVAILALGVGGYMLFVAYLAAFAEGNRWMQLLALIFATAFVLMRSLWIFGSPYSHITGKRLSR